MPSMTIYAGDVHVCPKCGIKCGVGRTQTIWPGYWIYQCLVPSGGHSVPLVLSTDYVYLDPMKPRGFLKIFKTLDPDPLERQGILTFIGD